MQQREYEELVTMLGKLEVLNPEIARIRFDRANTKHLSDVVHGMVSGFNPDCIDHYINRLNGVNCLRGIEEHMPEIERRALESKVLQKLGMEAEHTVGWIASHPTLEKIWMQVKDRPIAALAEGIEKSASRLHL